MKVTLEFDLPLEADEHFMALHGPDFQVVIDDMLKWLRTQRKYTTLHKEARAILDEAWDVFHRTLNEHGIWGG